MAGAGYKLFNTGDVLTAAQVNTYLMEQSVMVFANAAARTTALSGVVAEGMLSYLKDTDAVEVYNGSAWVASDDPNAIQNTIVDAKGDLIAASAADTPARLAVGNNGETLLADSAATTGLRWQNPKTVNYLLNSDCSIWQRGTSFSTNAAYGADRWVVTGSSTNFTTSQVTSSLPTGFRYAVKLQRNSGATATSIVSIAQALETTQTIPLQGKTVVLSFWAKKGADFSAASSNMIVRIYTGTGTDQTGTSFGTWTGYSEINATSVAITDSWVRYSTTASVASSATQIGVRLGFTPVGTGGADDSMQITGIQLEIGTVATPFQTATGTLAGELAACQRYFQRVNASSSNGVACFGQGIAEATTDVKIPISPVVTPRVAPTVSFNSQTGFRLYDLVNAAPTTTAMAVQAASYMDNGQFTVKATTTGLTQYRIYQLIPLNAAAAYIDISAEL